MTGQAAFGACLFQPGALFAGEPKRPDDELARHHRSETRPGDAVDCHHQAHAAIRISYRSNPAINPSPTYRPAPITTGPTTGSEKVMIAWVLVN